MNKRMKSLLSAIAVPLVLTGGALGATLTSPAGKGNLLAVLFNGRSVGSGIEVNGTVYVPARTVAEALGASVSYNRSTRTVSIDAGEANRPSQAVPVGILSGMTDPFLPAPAKPVVPDIQPGIGLSAHALDDDGTEKGLASDSYTVPLVDVKSVSAQDWIAATGLSKLSDTELHWLNAGVQQLRQQTSDGRFEQGITTGAASASKAEDFAHMLPGKPLNAQYTDAVLEGLKTVGIFVVDLDKQNLEVPGYTLTTDRIKTNIELKLRQNGLTIVDPTATIPDAVLFVYAPAFQSGNHTLFEVRVSCRQGACLARNRFLYSPSAITWEKDELGEKQPSEASNEVDTLVSHIMDEFINEYLKENPKR